MELIHPSFEILAMTGHPELPYSYTVNPNLLIERCGRVSYKSEDKITEGSADKFVNTICKNKHRTVLGHSWEIRHYINSWHKCHECFPGNWNKWLWISQYGEDNELFIAGTKRAFEDAEIICKWLKEDYVNFDENDIKGLALGMNEPFLMCATVKFIVNRGVSHEIVRHTIPQITQESTRYVTYKSGIQFLIPPWAKIELDTNGNVVSFGDEASHLWYITCVDCSSSYQHLLLAGWTPQQARDVLINSTKTELVITTPLNNWQHIFRQRALGLTGRPHPEMEQIMVPCMEEFAKLEPEFFNEDVLRNF